MSDNSRVFHGIDAKAIERAMYDFKASGIEVKRIGHEFDVDTKRMGVKLHATWDGKEALTVVIVDKSWLVSCGRVWLELETATKGAMR